VNQLAAIAGPGGPLELVAAGEGVEVRARAAPAVVPAAEAPPP
jgi:hypothetical protein